MWFLGYYMLCIWIYEKATKIRNIELHKHCKKIAVLTMERELNFRSEKNILLFIFFFVINKNLSTKFHFETF